MKLKAYDPSTKEIVCRIVRDRRHMHFISDRALGPGEPHFHAYHEPYARIEASTDRTLKVPGIPANEIDVLGWLMVQGIKLKLTTYLKMLTTPEDYELDELHERGDLFIGLETTDGQSDGATCVVIDYVKPSF